MITYGKIYNGVIKIAYSSQKTLHNEDDGITVINPKEADFYQAGYEVIVKSETPDDGQDYYHSWLIEDGEIVSKWNLMPEENEEEGVENESI